MTKLIRKIAILLTLSALPAAAHHSVYGIMDVSKLVEVRGQFQSADILNPHAWFHFTEVDEHGEPVLDDEGNPVVWSFETPGPGALRRMGVTEDLFSRYGDEIFIIYTSRQRDGANRGLFDLSVFPDGNVLILGNRDDPRFAPILEELGKL